MSSKVSCKLLEAFQVQVVADKHSWIIDAPESKGGDGLAPSPFGFLLGSLGGCLTLTVNVYAARSGVPIEKLGVDVTGDWEGEGDDKQYHIKAVVKVRGDLDEKALKKIEKFTERCAVHKILSKGCILETRVEHVQ